MRPETPLRIAFIVGTFPLVSETFIINQVADLMDRGLEVEIFAFERGSNQFVSERYKSYKMAERTHYLDWPKSKVRRVLDALPDIFHLLCRNPRALLRALNVTRYGKKAGSLQLLHMIAPFTGKRFDLVHCHFGTTAVGFLTLKELLKMDAPLVTSFYGYDVSIVFKEYPPDFYDQLKREGSLFFVMSNDMKRRVLAKGFEEAKVKVLPVSIDVESYPFFERHCGPDKPVEIVSVGRMVEKKGFDDLLRALAIVRQRSARAFHCSIIGGGELQRQLHSLCSSLALEDVVDFKGFMTIEDVIRLLPKMHLMAQPSKTAGNGDME